MISIVLNTKVPYNIIVKGGEDTMPKYGIVVNTTPICKEYVCANVRLNSKEINPTLGCIHRKEITEDTIDEIAKSGAEEIFLYGLIENTFQLIDMKNKISSKTKNTQISIIFYIPNKKEFIIFDRSKS